MSVVKVIELISESTVSWEEAAQAALKEASKTVENIEGLYVKDLKAVVENNKITKYRANVKISFVVKEH